MDPTKSHGQSMPPSDQKSIILNKLVLYSKILKLKHYIIQEK